MITVRDAAPGDSAALVSLAASAPMIGEITVCVERAPDFFALNRLEGSRWRVGVAAGNGARLTGCIAATERGVYLRGGLTQTGYIGDLKVSPDARGGRTTHALLQWAQDACGSYGPATMPTLVTIMAGNHRLERLTSGRLGLSPLTRFATIRIHAVPLLLPRRLHAGGLRICAATPGDADVMMALWRRVAVDRQFAPVFDADSFTRWIAAAPGLNWDDYWLAWRGDRLVGFVGVWEQSAMKQLRVVSYSRRLAATRVAINAIGRVTGGATLPPRGSTLRAASIVHPCVPVDEPAVFGALLRQAHGALRARNFAFFTVGLDIRDPLTSGLRGLWAQPTDVHGYVATFAGRYAGPALDDRPFHYDIALV